MLLYNRIPENLQHWLLKEITEKGDTVVECVTEVF